MRHYVVFVAIFHFFDIIKVELWYLDTRNYNGVNIYDDQ